MSASSGAAADRDRPTSVSTTAKRSDNRTVAPDEQIDHARCEAFEQRVLASLPPGPRYGTPGWFALSERDARRLHGLFVAVACHRRMFDPKVLADELREDLAERDREARRRLRVAGLDVHDSWRERDLGSAVERAQRAAAARQAAKRPRRDSRPVDLAARRRWIETGS